MVKMKKSLQKGKYLDIRRIIAKYPKCVSYIIFGAGGLGKTTTALMFLEKQYKKEINRIKQKIWTQEEVKNGLIKINNKFMWLNRTDVEIEEKKNGLFDRQGWIVSGKKVYVQIEITYFKDDNSSEEITKMYPLLLGTYQALNNASKIRGGSSFQDYRYIIWDEFMDEQNNYLKNEANKLKSILTTTLRDREGFKMFFFSNSISKDAPLFKQFNFNVNSIEKGEQAYYPEKKTVIIKPIMSEELTQSYEKSDLLAFLGKDDEYINYRVKDNFLNDDDDMILREIEKNFSLKPIWNICFLSNKLGVYKYRTGIYISYKLNSGTTYYLTKADALKNGETFVNIDKLYYYLNSKFNNKKLWFNDGIVKEIVLQFLEKTK